MPAKKQKESITLFDHDRNAQQVAADRAWEAAMAAESSDDKERSLCGHCKRRFASVSCEECRRGYCLRCAGGLCACWLFLPPMMSRCRQRCRTVVENDVVCVVLRLSSTPS